MAGIKTILITGATDGIGRATALAIAARGHRVIAHGRSQAKVHAVVDEIREHTGDPARADGAVADLASLDAVRALAEQTRELAPRLDVLLNNAGVFMKERALSADGFEMTWAVNHLAHFLLTHLLLDHLASSAPARVITVSSIAHTRGQIHWDDLQLEQHFDDPQAGPQARPQAGPQIPGYRAYAQSKLANVLFANALARRVASRGITSNSLHPGVIGTKMLRQGFGMEGGSLEEGIATSVHLALAPEVEGVTGHYFAAARQSRASERARDESAQERLWKVTEDMLP